MPSSGAADATRAFFGSRAADWDQRFPDDGPRYRRAVVELAPRAGGVVLDAACGTGRALPELRRAVGDTGTVLGVDLTPEMISTARGAGRDAVAALVLGDVSCLPLRTGALDAIFAAGLISHLDDPVAGLRELARVCRPQARLALFHPIGRAALAHRHGHALTAEDVREPANIAVALERSGWACESVDDAEDRYLVLAVRT